jgi:hypothetical protein
MQDEAHALFYFRLSATGFRRTIFRLRGPGHIDEPFRVKSFNGQRARHNE